MIFEFAVFALNNSQSCCDCRVEMVRWWRNIRSWREHAQNGRRRRHCYRRGRLRLGSMHWPRYVTL